MQPYLTPEAKKTPQAFCLSKEETNTYKKLSEALRICRMPAIGFVGPDPGCKPKAALPSRHLNDFLSQSTGEGSSEAVASA
jgi:hypothetical protein